MKKRIFSLLLILGLTTSATVALGQNPISWLTQQVAPESTKTPATGIVLAAHDEADATAFENDVYFEVNIPAVFNDTVTFNATSVFETLTVTLLTAVDIQTNSLTVADEIIAPNILYSLTGTDGLEITGDQILTIVNTDKGSSQNIFKNFKVGGDTAAAGSNTDTFEFEAGSNIGLSLSDKKLTISNTFTLPTQPWSLTGTNVYLSTSTNNVGIGTSAPDYKLHVVGTSFFAGNSSFGGDVTLGDDGSDTVTITGGLSAGSSIKPIVDLGSDLGSSALRFNNLYVGTINTNSTLSTAGQALFTYEPSDTSYTQASVLINPTSPLANSQLLGIGQGGYQRMLVDAEGDLTLGYNDAISAPASDYPLNIYGHSGTRVSYIDTSGNMTLNGSLTVNGGLSGTNYTQGSVIFQGASGLTQDNSNFFWDDTNNRLGIGTISPGKMLTLDVTTSTGSQRGLSVIGTSGAEIAYLGNRFGTQGGASLQLNESGTKVNLTSSGDNYILGNLGIRTSTPVSNLHISGASTTVPGILTLGRGTTALNANDSVGKLQFYNNDSQLTTQNIFADIEAFSTNTVNTDAAAGYLVFRTTGTTVAGSPVERMRIDSSGNVGIGTTAPSSNLQVYGESSKIHLFAPSTNTEMEIDGSGASLVINRFGSSTTRNAATTLKTSDTTYWQYGLINTTTVPGADNNFIIYDSVGSRVGLSILSNSGNVGIGTTNPGATLDVNGGTNTTTAPLLNLAQTWNGAGVVFTGIKMNITNTASHSSSNFLDFQVGGVSSYTIGRGGGVNQASTLTFTGVGTAKHIVSSGSGSALYLQAAGARILEIGDNSSTAHTSGIRNQVNISQIFNPTSGTGVWNMLSLAPTIEQTGGANGISRGLYINPTITAAADWRSLEVSTGNVIFNSTSGSVGIGTTAPGAKLNSLSTTEQLRLSYNASNYSSFTTNSAGNLQISTTGNHVGIQATPSVNQALYIGGTTGLLNWGHVIGAGANTADLTAHLSIKLNHAAVDGLTIKGIAAQTSEYLNISSSTGTGDIFRILSSGNVGVSNTSPQLALHVGSSATTDSTALLRLQDANSTCDFTADSGSPSCGSDLTLKKDISTMNTSDLLTRISNLRPVSYRWQSQNGSASLQYGFIAQEVETQFPDLVRMGTWVDGTQRKFLNTGGLMPYVIGAVKEQQLQITELKTISTALAHSTNSQVLGATTIDDTGDLVALEQRVTDLENQVATNTSALSQLQTTVANLFKNATTFLADVTFKGQLFFNPNQTGTVIIPAGSTAARISFKRTLPQRPIVNATAEESLTGQVTIKDVTPDSFTIELTQTQDHAMTINWLATLKDSENSNTPTVEILGTSSDNSPLPSLNPSSTPSPAAEASPALEPSSTASESAN